MSTARAENVRIAGIASAVPETVVTSADDALRFGAEETQRVVKNTGVHQRHIAKLLCASDLAQPAALRLMADLGWDPLSVDALIYVTQCPDFPAPSTACLMQTRLGFGTHCAAFDVNLGCSGYPYGLWMASSFIATGMKRVMLLVGDTASRAASPHDRSVVPLFGDAASATAIEYHPGAPPIDFVLGTDGRGAKHLNSRAGGYRHRWTPASQDMFEREDGVVRSDEQTYMNGAEVLTFAIEAVPKLMAEIKAKRGWSEEDVDAYVFHQASSFMLKTVARCSRIPPQKVVLGMKDYGNTSVASIPLAISDQLREPLSTGTRKLVLGGFGIGWSWAAAAVECGHMAMPEVLVIPDVYVEPEF